MEGREGFCQYKDMPSIIDMHLVHGGGNPPLVALREMPARSHTPNLAFCIADHDPSHLAYGRPSFRNARESCFTTSGFGELVM